MMNGMVGEEREKRNETEGGKYEERQGRNERSLND